MTGAELQAIQLAGQVAQAGMQDAKNLRQYKRQRKDNLDDWHRQNQYNSPVQQMARLKEAGLNPALMYGKSGGTGQSTSLPNKTEQSTGIVPDFNTGLGYAELELMRSNIEANKSTSNLNALKGATEAENTALVKKQTAKTGAEAQSAQATANLAKELTDAQLQAQLIDIKGKEAGVDQTRQQTKQSVAQTANIEQNTKKAKAETKRLTATQKTFIDQERAKLYKYKEEIKMSRLQQDSEYAKRVGTEIDNMINSVKADAAQQGISIGSVSEIFGSLLSAIGKIEQSTNFSGQPMWMSDYVYQEYMKYKKNK